MRATGRAHRKKKPDDETLLLLIFLLGVFLFCDEDEMSGGALSVSNHFTLKVGIKETVLLQKSCIMKAPPEDTCRAAGSRCVSWNYFSHGLG